MRNINVLDYYVRLLIFIKILFFKIIGNQLRYRYLKIPLNVISEFRLIKLA